MPVLIVICWVGVNCVAWWAPLIGTMPFFSASASAGSVDGGKCDIGSKGGRTPPSRESETWILVSLVDRETVAVRAGRGMVGLGVKLQIERERK
jgi:hypothetical protein